MSEERLPEPDWARLGARFGVADVCVPFPSPAEVYVHDENGARLLAEDVIALREDAWGVRLQVACGLFLGMQGASLAHVEPESRTALVEKRVRAPARPRKRASRVRDEWFAP